MKKWVEYLASVALIASIAVVFSLTVWTLFHNGDWTGRERGRELPPRLTLSAQQNAASHAPLGSGGQTGGTASPQEVSESPEMPEEQPDVPSTGATHTQPATPEAEDGAGEKTEPETQRSLLIGDSRAVGLAEYGDLEETDFFADVGMSVYSLWKKEVTVGEHGKIGLEDLLSGAQYDKIYLMLGINELGYDQDQTIRTYTETVEQIQSLQPDAQVYLMANLHVTQRRAEGDRVYNNENLDAINSRIAQLAGEQELTYLDVNPLFDDDAGALDSQYTSDGVHLLARYDDTWCQWLRENS